MTVGEWSSSASFDVVADPRRDLEPAALQAQYELAREIWLDLSRSHEMVEKINSVRAQIDGWTSRVEDEETTEAADAIVASLDDIEGRIRQPVLESSQDMLNFQPMLDNQLVNLCRVVEASPGYPTVASAEVFAQLGAELDGIESDLDEVLGTEVPKLEAMLEDADVPRIGTK